MAKGKKINAKVFEKAKLLVDEAGLSFTNAGKILNISTTSVSYMSRANTYEEFKKQATERRLAYVAKNKKEATVKSDSLISDSKNTNGKYSTSDNFERGTRDQLNTIISLLQAIEYKIGTKGDQSLWQKITSPQQDMKR